MSRVTLVLTYITQSEYGTIKPIMSATLMNMLTDKWKVHLQQTVLSEVNASAVPQFSEGDEYRNVLDTGDIFFHTKKTMILFI
jgi:hypothetical protein